MIERPVVSLGIFSGPIMYNYVILSNLSCFSLGEAGKVVAIVAIEFIANATRLSRRRLPPRR
jgi:hypothetical protein